MLKPITADELRDRLSKMKNEFDEEFDKLYVTLAWAAVGVDAVILLINPNFLSKIKVELTRIRVWNFWMIRLIGLMVLLTAAIKVCDIE